MKIDSAFKTKAVNIQVRRRNGISSMIRYNYDEYTTEEPKHKAKKTREQEYGFMVYTGKSASKTDFSYMLTDHVNDSVWVSSAIAMNTEFTSSYIYFDWLELDLETINKSKDIYTSNLVFNNDTSKWEIKVMNRIKFRENMQPVVVGVITNKESRFLVRLVAEFENGEKAQFAPPGSEVLEGETP